MPTWEDGTGLNYTGSGLSWRSLKQLQKVTQDPPFEVVVFGFDLAPGPRRDGLIVARQQDAGPFAQNARARRCRTWLEPNRNAESAGVDDPRRL